MIIGKLKRPGEAASKKMNYLLYALGEVTLIVVGILVAIQVDAWRESENNKKRVANYFALMENDLSDQLAEIDAQVKSELEILRDAEKLIRAYGRDKRFVADADFSAALGNINNWRTFIKIDPTFEQLLVTGEVGLIENELIKKNIFSYYHQLRKVEAVVTENHQYVQSSFSPFVLRNSVHNLPNFQANLYKKIVDLGYVPANIDQLLSDQSNDNSFVQINTDRPDVKLELFNSIKFRYRIAAVHLSYLENLREDTRELAKSLKP
jgi:hypothetical protein